MKEKKQTPFQRKVNIYLITIITLIITKILVICINYGGLFQVAGFWEVFKFFYNILSADLLIRAIVIFGILLSSKTKKAWIHCTIGTLSYILFVLYLLDICAIWHFQQRLVIGDIAVFLQNAGSNITFYYIFGFVLFASLYFIALRGLARTFILPLKEKQLSYLGYGCLLIYLLPSFSPSFPQANLSQKNILESNYHSLFSSEFFTLNSYMNLKSQDPLPNLTEKEINLLQSKKQSLLELAMTNPEGIFQSFDRFKEVKDEFGNQYFPEVLEVAAAYAPKYAFEYLPLYQDATTSQGRKYAADILKAAIKQNPDYAFHYLSKFSSLTDEKGNLLSKELLTFALDNYNTTQDLRSYLKSFHGEGRQENVILVFAESFSTIDSQKVGELYDRLPKFDKIMEDGVTYTNFLANGSTSEKGHISTFLGVESTVFSDAVMNNYQKYTGISEALPAFFNSLGYQTAFISTAPLSFLDQRSFLTDIGFQNILGEEFFTGDEKYTFNAAPDESLYKKTIEYIQGSGAVAPYFLTIQTISSHLPYSTPYGSEKEEVYRYIDESFSDFYSQLKKSDFFSNGLLIVVSDHRKMTPLENGEYEKRGPSAYGRILATVIGTDIPAGKRDDTIYQQTDLFSSLKKRFATGDTQLLSIYNDVFSGKEGRKRGITSLFNKQVAVTKKDGESEFIENPDFFSSEKKSSPVIEYVKSSISFQRNQNSSKLYTPTPAQTLSKEKEQVLIIGHMGTPEETSPNSLYGFQQANTYNADGIEMDVSFTKDGYSIVFHGPTLISTQCVSASKVSWLTLDQVKKCKLMNGEEILTLEEMLQKLKGLFAYYFIELKIHYAPQREVQILDAVNIVKKLGMEDQVVFTTYDKDANYILGSQDGIKAAWDSYSPVDSEILRNFTHQYYMQDLEDITSDVVKNTKEIGKRLVAYTVNSESDFLDLYSKGVRIFFTDNIPLLRSLVKNIGGGSS